MGRLGLPKGPGIKVRRDMWCLESGPLLHALTTVLTMLFLEERQQGQGRFEFQDLNAHLPHAFW